MRIGKKDEAIIEEEKLSGPRRYFRTQSLESFERSSGGRLRAARQQPRCIVKGRFSGVVP